MNYLNIKISRLLVVIAALTALLLPAAIFAGNATYTYDTYDRLQRVTYDNGPVVEYTYDASGNLESRKVKPCGDQLPVRIAGPLMKSYSTIQKAYNMAVDGDVIQGVAINMTENVILDRNITVTLEGGYNCSFEVVTGKTTLWGDITLSDGTTTIENIETLP